MKRFLISLCLALSTFSGCNKFTTSNDSEEIVINIISDKQGMDVSTKATAVTGVPSALYWGATYSNGSGKWSTAYSGLSSNRIYTGYYQTYSPTTYTYYVANCDFTTGGYMTVSNNGTDIVAGVASSNSTTPSVTMGHIFARTGSLTLSTPSGYSVSGVSWYIVGSSGVHGTAGSFYMPSLSWSSSSAPLNSWTYFDSGSDLYLIPGAYTIKVCFTLTKGEFSRYYEQTAGVTLYQGYINNIYATTNSSDAVQVTVSTSVASWGSSSSSFDWSNP